MALKIRWLCFKSKPRHRRFEYESFSDPERTRPVTRGHLVTRDSESFVAKTRPPRGTLAISVDLCEISVAAESAARSEELTQVLGGKAENEQTPSALALGVFWLPVWRVWSLGE